MYGHDLCNTTRFVYPANWGKETNDIAKIALTNSFQAEKIRAKERAITQGERGAFEGLTNMKIAAGDKDIPKVHVQGSEDSEKCKWSFLGQGLVNASDGS
jgi:hypothetical protein